jgi:diphthamide synthase subunit DPH2
MSTQTIVICSSAAFYKHANEVKAELEKAGCTVVVPKTARRMAEAGDYDVSHYKTWMKNEDDYNLKADYMRTHFDEITKGDIVLVINDEKHGQANYIGPNVLMEMSLAWYQNKPVYILNGMPMGSAFEEEIKGFLPIVLDGDLAPLIESAKK